MKAGFLWILISLWECNGQQKLKRKDIKNNPTQPFSFLVEGNIISVANTVRIEQMDVLIGINFSMVKWREKLALFDEIFEGFEQLGFFSDEALKRQYAGMCIFGTELFNDFRIIFNEVFQFKNENIEDITVNVCSVTPLSLNVDELDRGIENLGYLFNAFNEHWTPQEIKTNATIQSVIFDYCSYLNDLSIVLEYKGSSILRALEELSDGKYPEILFGNLIKDCSFAKNGEGEDYKVLNCIDNKAGMRCQVQISQATNLREYMQYHPVHYNGIAITGNEKGNLFGKTKNILELKYLQCEEEFAGDFLVCEEQKIPDMCKMGLDTEDATSVINYCNFSRSEPHIGTILPNGGLLIQSTDRVEIASNKTRIGQQPPLIIYTPDILTVRHREEDYVFAPSIKMEELIIIESKLTEEELDKLQGRINWDETMKTIDLDFWFDVALLIVEVLIIPFALISFILACKQRNDIKDLSKDIFGSGNRNKDNFKRNRQQLLRTNRDNRN
jgi:hypothetical protein